MSETITKLDNAKDAIRCAFALFQEFYSDSDAEYVLLDGVRYDEESDEWCVTIGFDIGRKRTSGFPILGDGASEPIRERRTVHLRGSDGEFLRIS